MKLPFLDEKRVDKERTRRAVPARAGKAHPAGHGHG